MTKKKEIKYFGFWPAFSHYFEIAQHFNLCKHKYFDKTIKLSVLLKMLNGKPISRSVMKSTIDLLPINIYPNYNDEDLNFYPVEINDFFYRIAKMYEAEFESILIKLFCAKATHVPTAFIHQCANYLNINDKMKFCKALLK